MNELSELVERAESLEKRCGRLRKIFDLKNSPEDSLSSKIYNEEIGHFGALIKEYNEMASILINAQKLEIKEQSGPFNSLECTRCGNQMRVSRLYDADH